MKRDVYVLVVKEINACEFDFRACNKRLIARFPNECPEVLRSIASLQYTKRVKQTYDRVNNPAQRKSLYEEYKRKMAPHQLCPPEPIICQIAKRIRFSPFLLGKIILSELLSEETDLDVTKDLIKKYMKHPYTIPDRRLSVEIDHCRKADEQYGHWSEAVKQGMGAKHETKVRQMLEKHGLSYKDENVIRKQGFDKTPDFLLNIPIAIDGKAVNWIESRASFADDDVHKENMSKQLAPYWNRFGAGMVIYWFGFIDDLAENRIHGAILLKDHFPENFIVHDPYRMPTAEADEAEAASEFPYTREGNQQYIRQYMKGALAKWRQERKEKEAKEAEEGATKAIEDVQEKETEENKGAAAPLGSVEKSLADMSFDPSAELFEDDLKDLSLCNY